MARLYIKGKKILARSYLHSHPMINVYVCLCVCLPVYELLCNQSVCVCACVCADHFTPSFSVSHVAATTKPTSINTNKTLPTDYISNTNLIESSLVLTPFLV